MPRRRARRPKGMGQVLFRGGTWSIRWREGGRRRFKSGFPSEDTATRVLNRILVDVAEGRKSGAPDPKNLPTLAELAKDWVERREHTHRSWRDDKNRWNKHLKDAFGACKPPEVDGAMIRRFVETKIAAGLSSTTVGHLVRGLSTFFSDLVERGYVPANPVVALPRSTKRLFRNAHDPKTTPFLERQEDVQRVFLKLEQPFATLFAIGALAGLRPGEILALEWGDFDLEKGRLMVQRQVRHRRVGPPKSGKPRLVPLIGPLVKVLAEYRLATGGAGRLFPPLNPNKGGTKKTPPRFLSMEVVHEKLREALRLCELPETLTLYQCTRHTYGAQHVMGGGSLATLREILGHSSVTVTERYGHLRPDLFTSDDLLKFDRDLSRAGGAVIDLAARRADAVGHALGTAAEGKEKESA